MNEEESLHPFEGEDVVVGGEETPPEPTAGWAGFTEMPLLVQVERIRTLTALYAGDVIVFDRMVEEAGLPPEVGKSGFEFNHRQKLVIAYALNLVGFFSETILGPVADEILDMLVATEHLSMEDDLEAAQAGSKLAKIDFARMMGMTVEQYEEARKVEMERRRAEDNDPED